MKKLLIITAVLSFIAVTGAVAGTTAHHGHHAGHHQKK